MSWKAVLYCTLKHTTSGRGAKGCLLLARISDVCSLVTIKSTARARLQHVTIVTVDRIQVHVISVAMLL